MKVMYNLNGNNSIGGESMDVRTKVATACGIVGNALERWASIPDVQRKDDDDYVFYMEGPIVSSDADNFYGEGGKGYVTPNQMRAFLDDAKGKDIELRINSPGGSVFEANAMLSELLQHDGAITVRIIGACFSAAADFLTIPGSKRIAMPGSMVMIHNASTIAFGDSKQLRKVVDRLEKMNSQCIDRFAKACNYDKDELTKMMDDETFFTEEEALKGGFVDEVFSMDEEDESEEMDESEEDARQAVKRANEVVSHRLATIL